MHPKWECVPIGVSGNTDCYQPAEKKFRITRQLLEVCNEFNQPVGIITKNAGILRDKDLLEEMASKNLVSVRDGKKPDEYLFFVYFENGNEAEPCGGEIRGMMKMASDKVGIFKGDDDPCQINFTFNASSVEVKETGSCGNFRGIKCFFNDTYTKKKEAKSSAKKK